MKFFTKGKKIECKEINLKKIVKILTKNGWVDETYGRRGR